MAEMKPRKPGRPKGRTAKPSEVVSRLRAKLDLTQKDFARLLGVTEDTVARYERLGRLPASESTQLVLQKMAEEAGEAYP